MAKRRMVSFGLSGPVTQPTTDVPGGGAAAGTGGGAAAAAAGTCAVAFGGGGLPVPGGMGEGITPACCCTRAERGDSALRMANGS